MNPILEMAKRESERVSVRLRTVRKPADFYEITASWHKRIDEITAEGLSATGAILACKAGCWFCCYFKVDVHPDEVFRLAEFIKKRLGSAEIAGIVQRADENRKKIASLSHAEHLATNIPCPLLKDGKCSVYEARPAACRKFHAQNVNSCKYSYDHPTKDSPSTEVPQIKIALSAVYLSIQRAFSDAGFDSQHYDLSASLYEALTNPKCEKRWRDGKQAFSRESVARDG